VLRTRPGLNPPQICLPSILSDTGHTCASTHAFASSLLQAYIAVAPLPLATLRLRQAGYGLCSGLVSQSQASPISSRALPGTQRMPQLGRTFRCAPLPAGYAERFWRRAASPRIAIREMNMMRMMNFRFVVLLAVLSGVVVSPAYAMKMAVSELRTRLSEAKDTEAVIAIAEETIKEGEQAIEELKNEVKNLKSEKDKLQNEKIELQRIQTVLTSGLIGAFVTAIIAIFGFVFKTINSKVDRDFKRLEVAEKLSVLNSKGVTIPIDIRNKYMAPAPASGSATKKS